ncbi:hypothetical protein PG991_010497, partial [Apiospora marii]
MSSTNTSNGWEGLGGGKAELHVRQQGKDCSQNVPGLQVSIPPRSAGNTRDEETDSKIK